MTVSRMNEQPNPFDAPPRPEDDPPPGPEPDPA